MLIGTDLKHKVLVLGSSEVENRYVVYNILSFYLSGFIKKQKTTIPGENSLTLVTSDKEGVEELATQWADSRGVAVSYLTDADRRLGNSMLNCFSLIIIIETNTDRNLLPIPEDQNKNIPTLIFEVSEMFKSNTGRFDGLQFIPRTMNLEKHRGLFND